MDGQAKIEYGAGDDVEQALPVVGKHVNDGVPIRRLVINLDYRRLSQGDALAGLTKRVASCSNSSTE